MGGIAERVPLQCRFLLLLGRPWLHGLLHGPSDKFPNHPQMPYDIADNVVHHEADHVADGEPGGIPTRVLLDA